MLGALRQKIYYQPQRLMQDRISENTRQSPVLHNRGQIGSCFSIIIRISSPKRGMIARPLQAIRTSAPKRRTAPIPRGRSIHYRSPFASCDDASKQPRRTPPAPTQPQPQPRQASTRHRQPSSRTASQPDSSASLRHHPAWAQEQAAQYRNS